MLRGVNTQGDKIAMSFQSVENIHKPLASVAKMCDANQAVLYHPEGSAIFDLGRPENMELKRALSSIIKDPKLSRTPLKRENDVYNFELDVCVAASRDANGPQTQEGFAWQR